MTKRHNQEFDPFDVLDDVDGFDGYIIEDDEGNPEPAWFKGFSDDIPLCGFGYGDSEGFCIRHRFGCAIEGCEYASHE